MKLPAHTPFGLLALSALLTAGRLPAQTTPPPSDEIVTLSVFEVRSPKDTAYRVANSVATTGIAQEATGFGERSTSTRHIRQLPAIISRSW